ncbi:MAG: hypothetical protein H7X77_01735, partial [Anaerolineae bacterium]|nr:hypothetical protein [Anaerolineae bacterium]
PHTIIGEAYIFRQIDSIWTQEAILVSFDVESFDSEFSILGISSGLDGDYAVLGAWNGATGHTTAAAYKIPEVDQGTPDNNIADAGTGLILLPQAGAPSGYATLAVALKTRPTQNVYLKLKTKKDSQLLLDNGGEAVPQLIVQFTRDNWDIPQSIRVRGTPDISGELTGKIKYKIKAGSAVEYQFVTPPPVMLTILADHFGLTSPVEGSVIEAPYEFAWQPYELATQYILKIKSDAGYKYKQQVNPAGSCTVDLCTFKPDFNLSPLPKNISLKWRVIAKDQQAVYKKKTPWVTFTSH